MSKTEAEQHADLVVEHLNDLENIKQAVIQKQHYEAAEVITKSIALIKSAHISNDYLAKENMALKQNLRIHIASMAMQGLLAGHKHPDDAIPELSFKLADRMLKYSKKKVWDGTKQKEEVKGTEGGLGSQ